MCLHGQVLIKAKWQIYRGSARKKNSWIGLQVKTSHCLNMFEIHVADSGLCLRQIMFEYQCLIE